MLLALCTVLYSDRLVHAATIPVAGSNSRVFATESGGTFSEDKGPVGVAAEVDGHRILLRDVTRICLVKSRAPIIDQMVQNYLVEREASRKGIVVADVVVDKRVADLRQSVAPARLEDVIAQHHSTMEQVRAAFKHKIQRGLITADQIPSVNMSHCRVILIKFDRPAGDEDVTATPAMFKVVQTQLAAGKDFGEVAAKYSDDSSKSASGDIGVVYQGTHDLNARVVTAALALEKGKISQPVVTDDGFWLVQAITTSADHPTSENAAYKAAHDIYVDEQSQFLSPQFVVGLISRANITYATDAECAPALGKPLPKAAAVVDGHVIPMQDVAAECLAENGPRVVDILVQNFIVDRECKRRNIVVSVAQVDQRVNALRKMIAPHTLDEGLAARHMTLDELRYNFHQDMERVQLVINQVKPVGMAHCRAILVKFQQGDRPTTAKTKLRSEAEALTLIKNIQSQIRKGKDFGVLASQYSELESKNHKGDLGVLYPTIQDMDTMILDAGLKLSQGKMTSEPVKTVRGYCLIQSLSTSQDHPKAENTMYANALNTYKEQTAQTLIPNAVIALIKKSKVIYYVHA